MGIYKENLEIIKSINALKTKTTELTFLEENNSITVDYFSIFDTDTFESNSINISFEKGKFLSNFNEFLSTNKLELSNSNGGQLIISENDKNRNTYNMELRNEDNGNIYIYDIEIDKNKINNTFAD